MLGFAPISSTPIGGSFVAEVADSPGHIETSVGLNAGVALGVLVNAGIRAAAVSNVAVDMAAAVNARVATATGRNAAVTLGATRI